MQRQHGRTTPNVPVAAAGGADRGGAKRAARGLYVQAVHVDILVVDFVAQHTQSQRYSNEGSAACEAVFVFPLPDGAAVTSFTATFSDGRRLVGLLEPRDVAKAVYRAARQRVEGTALLEVDRPDVFRTSVGSIQPGEEVTITLQYSVELPVERSGVRLTVPAHVGARYTPSSKAGGGSATELLESNVGSTARFSGRVSCRVGGSGIESLVSPTHTAQVALDRQRPNTAVVDFAADTIETDFVLVIRPRDIFEPRVYWEESAETGTHALMLSFLPKFELAAHAAEVIFMVDCSGSMAGSRMDQAKRAMQILLRSLPTGSCLNIVKFGSGFAQMFEKVEPYSEDSLARASSYVDGLDANMGGTRIKEALHAALHPATKRGFSRQVVLLTDGKVSNEQEIIDMAGKAPHRVFTLGVGSGVSTFLLNGVARASRGHACFVQDGERLEPACISLLKKALTPSVTDVCVTWPAAGEEDDFVIVPDATTLQSLAAPAPADARKGAGRPAPSLSLFDPAQRDPQACKVSPRGPRRRESPSEPTVIFADKPFHAFAIYEAARAPAHPDVVEIVGETPRGQMRLQVALPPAPETPQVPVAHHMAARALIRELEEKPGAAAGSCPAAEGISLTFGVLSHSTAFVVCDPVGNCEHGSHSLPPRPCSAPEICPGNNSKPASMGEVRQGAILMIRGRPCVVQSVCSSKTGKHGHAKTHIVAIDPVTGQKVEEIEPSTAAVECCDVDASAGMDESMGAPRDNARFEASLPRLERLLRLAAADGSFRCTAGNTSLESELGLAAGTVAGWARSLAATDVMAERIAATAIAVVGLRSLFVEEATTWGLVEEKALRWLAAQEEHWQALGMADVDALLAEAVARTGLVSLA